MSSRYIVGWDISSRRIDAAAIPLEGDVRLGVNVRLTHHTISHNDKQAKEWARDPAMRTAELGRAARTCLHTLHARRLDIACIAIEKPAGHGAQHMLPILGAVTSALDEYPLCWLTASEWRRILGAGPTKDCGHQKVVELVAAIPIDEHSHTYAKGWRGLYDHPGDAIGVALAYRQLLQQAETAA